MSVTVKHLNADSTFLLTFSPSTSPRPADLTAANGAFTVLIDPWLSGPSIVTASWFATTVHSVASAIQHLSEIEEPDVVVVSQNKPDHCHKATLLQLRPDAKTVIAAEPGAAKVIKSWNHFDPTRVHGLLKYDPRAKFGRSLRLRIPPLSAEGSPGEVNISFLPARNYVTGLHNAFGLTYQPPTSTRSIASIPTVSLPKATKYFHMPMSPTSLPPSSPPPVSPQPTRPMSFDQPKREFEAVQNPKSVRGHRPRLSRSSNTASSEFLPLSEQTVVRASLEANSGVGDVVHQTLTGPDRSPLPQQSSHHDDDPAPFDFVQSLPTPPDSPSGIAMPPSALFHHRVASAPSHQKSLSSVSSCPNLSIITPARPKAVSIIYSPHGLPLEDLRSYIENHLVRLAGALPLTLLMHSFSHIQNPWYLGGNIMTGVNGGAEIARALMARSWISAHDELKEDRGLSVKLLKAKRVTADEVREALWEGEDGEWLKTRGWKCDVLSLDVGKETVIGPTRDLSMEMEKKKESKVLRLVVDETMWRV